MKNNLYYTPTIEEFHIGFEYEFMNGDKWEESEMTIQDYKSNGPDYERSDSWFQEEILGGIRTVRVKYLDRDDIESLGWQKFTYKNLNGFIIFNKFLTVNYNYVKPIIDISYLPLFENQGLYRIFRGTIKNKSELIKLQQQLNIK